jgi:hypothetical protein
MIIARTLSLRRYFDDLDIACRSHQGSDIRDADLPATPTFGAASTRNAMISEVIYHCPLV